MRVESQQRRFRSSPRGILILIALELALCDGSALAQPGIPAPGFLPTGFADQLVVGGLNYPVTMRFFPDGRLIFVEQYSAKVRLIVNGALAAVDPVVVVDSVRTYAESGLLGIEVDPGWPARPYVYVQYTAGTSPTSIRISRFTVEGDLAFTGNGALTIDPATRYDVLTGLPDVSWNHNGGMLRFGPDGKLHSSLGEDNDACKAQDPTKLQGKILRLDVLALPPGPGGPPEMSLITPLDNPFALDPNPNARLVWLYGLRNPYSYHIDPATSAMFIADVGANTFEEVDRAEVGGLNFGWPYFEGPFVPGISCGPPSGTLAAPIYSYDRTMFQYGAGAAVISGGVYRRPASGPYSFPAEYDGDYFLSDAGEGFLRRLKGSGSSWSIAPMVPGQPNANDWGTNFDGAVDYEIGPDGALWYSKWSENISPAGSSIRRIIYRDALAVNDRPRGGVSFASPYPSPSTGRVAFEFSLPRPASVTLSIYDAGGRRVLDLVPGTTLEPGSHHSSWAGIDAAGGAVPGGVYVARLTVDGAAFDRRIVMFR